MLLRNFRSEKINDFCRRCLCEENEKLKKAYCSVPVCTFPWRDSYRRRNPGRYRGCRDRPAWAHSVGCLQLKPWLPLHSVRCCCHLLAAIHHRMTHCCPAEGPTVWIFSQRSAARYPGSCQTCALDPPGWRWDGRASRLRAAQQERKEHRSGSNHLCLWLWSGKFIKEEFSKSLSLSSTPSVWKLGQCEGSGSWREHFSALQSWWRFLDECGNVFNI